MANAVRDEVIVVDANSTETGQIQDGTAEHVKRLKSYIQGSVGSFFALVVTIYTSIPKQQGNNAAFIHAASVSLLFGFFFDFVVMVLCEGIKMPSRNSFLHQHKERLYISIFGSTLMLMLCGLFLLLFGNAKYAPLAIFPIVAFVFMIILFRRGSEFGHTESAINYREHDGKLNYYSELSSAVTTAAFVGLSTYVFSSPTLPQQNDEIKPTEIFLYIAIVVSLLLMQLTSVPPAVSCDTARERMMGVMRCLSYAMVGSLISVVILAAGEILQGVISTLIYIAGTIVFVVVIVLNELMEHFNDRNLLVEAVELDSLAMVVVGFTFGVLMVVYSTYANDRTKVDDQFSLLLVCMLSLCAAFFTSLSKVLFVSHSGATSGAWPQARMIFNYVSYLSAFVAAVSFLLIRVL